MEGIDQIRGADQKVRALLPIGKPVVIPAMRNPDDVASFTEAPTMLDTFGYTTHQSGRWCAWSSARSNSVGPLPVSIPRADGTGELFPFGDGPVLLTEPSRESASSRCGVRVAISISYTISDAAMPDPNATKSRARADARHPGRSAAPL